VAVCRNAAADSVRWAISAAWAIVPPQRRAVVYAGRQVDINGVAVLSALSQWGYPRPVLLVNDVAAARRVLGGSGADDFPDVEIVDVRSLRGVARLLRGRLILFTHFIYRGPRPRGRRLVVNLWHGDGPKTPLPEGEEFHEPASHALLSNNRGWGEASAEAFALTPDQLWVVGLPRVDEMLRPTGDDALRSLGLDPAVPIVLWAPTYRTAEFEGVRGWSDSADAEPFREVLRSADSPLRELHGSGRRQVVVKAHPFDASDYSGGGITFLTNDDLAGVGTNLYRFMGRCSALITDYSSIWIDYAALDRPIVLYCPDLRSYTEGRGFAGVPFEDAAPGPVVTTTEELRAVLSKLADGVDVGQEQRLDACRTLGVEVRFGATERLMTRIAAVLP
jgi:CDP-glycerol glycerophosphotransferase